MKIQTIYYQYLQCKYECRQLLELFLLVKENHMLSIHGPHHCNSIFQPTLEIKRIRRCGPEQPQPTSTCIFLNILSVHGTG